MIDMPQYLVEIIIPTYKRPSDLLRCLRSVISQFTPELSCVVGLAVWDDASDVFPKDEVLSIINSANARHIRIGQNTSNKGMSRNIYDLFKSSRAEFVTVLSDDDQLMPGALDKLVSCIQDSSTSSSEGAVFFPRSCYTDGGHYLFSVCTPFCDTTLINPSPLAALKYCHNGFILTGLVLRCNSINYKVWVENMDNSFFPVLALSAILRNYKVRFVNASLFKHTVNNQVYWERWGKTDDLRSLRLLSDYIGVLELIAGHSMKESLCKLDLVAALKLLSLNIRCVRKQYACHLNLPYPLVIGQVLSGGRWMFIRFISFLLAFQAHWRSRLGLPSVTGSA